MDSERTSWFPAVEAPRVGKENPEIWALSFNLKTLTEHLDQPNGRRTRSGFMAFVQHLAESEGIEGNGKALVSALHQRLSEQVESLPQAIRDQYFGWMAPNGQQTLDAPKRT